VAKELKRRSGGPSSRSDVDHHREERVSDLEVRSMVGSGNAHSRAGVLTMQRLAGNTATTQMVQCHQIEPDKEPEEEPVQRTAQALPVQRFNPVKAYKKWKNPKKGEYNVRRGESMPTDAEMAQGTQEEAGHVTATEVKYAIEQHHKDVAWGILRNEDRMQRIQEGIESEWEAKGKVGPSHADMLDLRLIAGDVLAAKWYLGLEKVSQFVNEAIKAQGDPNGGKRILWWKITEAINAEAHARVIRSGEFSSDVKLFDPSSPSNVGMRQNFLDKRKNVKLEHAYVPKEQIGPFSEALKLLPVVQFLLDRPKETKGGGGDKGTRSGDRSWKGGGDMQSTITVVDDAKSTPKFVRDKRGKSQSFRKKVAATDRFIKAIVSPEFLARVPAPKVNVHTKPAIAITSPGGFRANGIGGRLDVAYNEAQNVIAHEVGHAIESFLPLKYWHDMHLMLGARHEAAGGGGARSGETIFTKHSEGRFGGEYVTGKYTSTAYRSGMAEVVSMAFQYFVDPAQAKKLVEKDPMHAALVLRSFNPKDYKSIDALRPFDKYLPHK
jgi:hypothetical protein